MNLETRVEPRLWEAISASVENRNFRGAILDGIHLLSEVIRERSGLEGDGVQLVGAAFGGNSPKLKVNKLQSESEQNIQRGVEALLRGLYQAIRNPRSHGTHPDDEATATAIVLFVDYLLRVVDQSKSPFSLSTFVARVLDPDFVPIARYAELLIAEIPPGKRVAICRELFSRRSETDHKKVSVFLATLMKQMSEDEVVEIYDVMSDELRQADDEETMRFVLGAFPADLWPRISEIARMRVEHKLIASIKSGKRNAVTGQMYGGGFGTWATVVIRQFTLKDQLWRAVANAWRSSNGQERHYAIHHFGAYANEAFDQPPPYVRLAVKQRLKAGDLEMKSLVEAWAAHLVPFTHDPLDATGPWLDPFKDELRVFAVEEPAVEPITDDDVPF